MAEEARAPAQVDVWHVRTDAVRDASTLAACMNVMSTEERAHHARFVFERHRHEYLVTRGLVRGVLSKYTARPPQELLFDRTEYGRPNLQDCGGLQFNVTNTNELVVCAVRYGGEVGVDTEPLRRSDEILGVAETVFTDYERERLNELPPPLRARRAVELWTLKEAYMKARGLGFSLPVDKFEIVFEGSARLRLHPPIVDDSTRWALSTFELEGHFVSHCVESKDSGGVVFRKHAANLSLLVTS